MRILPTIFIILISLGLGGLVVVQQLTGNLDFIFGTPSKKVGEMVYNFNPGDVGRIHILNHDGTRGVLVKKGGAWKLDEPWEDYADARTVKSLIDFAARLQIEDVIERDEVEDLADYGLKKSRIEVELFDKDGSPLCHFKIGRNTAWRGFDPTEEVKPGEKPSSFPTLVIRPFEDDMESYLYVCTDIVDPNIRTVGIRTLFDEGLRMFRGHQVFYNTPLYASEITLKEKNSEITLKRADLRKTTPWKIHKPFDLATNPETLNKLIVGLAQLQAHHVLDESAVALPAPLPDNISHSITIRYLIDGILSEPVTASFYPPETEQSPDVRVVVSEGTKKRPAILLVPRIAGSTLASLPRSVNALRSRTFTSLSVRQIDAVEIGGPQGRNVKLALAFDPHERAQRWHTVAGQYKGTNGAFLEQYRGPASEAQTADLFSSLFKDEVVGFTNDAATDPKKYGFDQPVRQIKITLKDQSVVNFVVGEQLLPHYYARRADGGRPLEISEAAYLAALDGKAHREFTILPPVDGNPITQQSLSLLGLDNPTQVTVPVSNGSLAIHIAQSPARHYYANRLTEDGRNTPHVIEIKGDSIAKMELQPFRWRTSRLWNISRFDIKGLTINRQDAPPLELEYNFYTQIWRATTEGRDVTALLNPHKAEKLLKKLSDIKVHHWLGPDSESAAHRLQTPTLEISVLIEEIDDDGERTGLVPHVLKLSQIVPNVPNQLYYGSTSLDPNYFLVDVATVKRLAVKLLEED
ncbi:DUF4340 domain-containing protein [Verrucomicrobiaceae bacterium 227]